MIVAQDTFLICVDRPKNNTLEIKGIGDKNLVIDTDYNKYSHAVQIGTIYALPVNVSAKYVYDLPLQIGDRVIFHHFVCQLDHKINIAENVYRAEYFHIYAKIENDMIEPIEDLIFVEPIMEPESNMFAGHIQLKSQRELIKKQGVVFAASKSAKSKGIYPGDKVHFTQSADYSMKVIDKSFYRMRLRNIISIERDGEIVCLDDRILIKVLPESLENKPAFEGKKNLQLKGEVISVGSKIIGLNKGDKVDFFSAMDGGIVLNGNHLCIVELRHINFKLN